MPTVTIDGRTVNVGEGCTVLTAAANAGITIPTLCYHQDLSIDGSCRLCVVEIENVSGQHAACSLSVQDGMVVHTEAAGLIETRRTVLELLLRRYVDAGYATNDHDETEFEHWLRHYDVRVPSDEKPTARYQVDSDPNPFVWVDLNKCILCSRCVRACAELQGRFVWSVGYRGDRAKIIAGLDSTMLDARCESCSACVAYCPTGALDDRMAVGLGKPDKVVPTTCGYCGVGCGFDLNVKDGKVIRVTSDASAPVNGMQLCVKGRYGYDFVHHPDRLLKPRVRRYLLGDEPKAQAHLAGWDWIEVSWDNALDVVARKLAQIKRESGPDAIGILGSAKCTNEENYLMQKFARQVVGTHNIDHCARLCHASTMAGLSMALGTGAMSNSMADVADHAAAIFIIGSNTTEQHPVFGTRIRQAVLRRGTKLIVADPRKIDITEFATVHLRHAPGTDVALLNGLMHVILKNEWHDQRFIDERCESFEDFRESIEKYTPEYSESLTGVSVDELHHAAEIMAHNKPMAAVWAMGITQHTSGVLNVLALANLQMLLGNLGVAGGGVNPLRGQNNVQGASDMGVLPNVFPGYQPVTDAATTQKFDTAWMLAPHSDRPGTTPALGMTNVPGLTVTEMVDAFGKGRIRGFYVLGEDLAMTEPDVNHAKASLESGEFLVVQEIFPSETAKYADVLLPGITFAEKMGTFTNTERRVQMVRQAIPALGEARPDWRVTSELARRVLTLEGRTPTGLHAGWNYRNAAEIFDEACAVTPSYAGISHARLERGDQLQWPVPDAAHPGTPILHIGSFPRGRGKFHVVDQLPPAELPTKEFPFVLTTGRVLYHWHGGELTRRAKGLTEVYPETLIEISPDDAVKLGFDGVAVVRVRSRRGEMIANAIITDRVAPGVVFGNFHFPGPGNVNNLTVSALDPVAKIPEYKVCAVAVERVSVNPAEGSNRGDRERLRKGAFRDLTPPME